MADDLSSGYSWNVQILRETKSQWRASDASERRAPGGNATERLLYSVEETAHIWSIGRSSVYAAIQKAQVAFVKLGKSTRIPRAEVERVAREGLGHSDARRTRR
jgi:excisionase family DNA binding protein